MFQHFTDSTTFEEETGAVMVLRPLVDAAAVEETRVRRTNRYPPNCGTSKQARHTSYIPFARSLIVEGEGGAFCEAHHRVTSKCEYM